MSFDFGGIAAAIGQGAAHGLAIHKQESKEKEQLNYDRGRQKIQDEQQAQLHSQTVKQNDFTLAKSATEQAETNRKLLLNNNLGQLQKFDSVGDIDNAAKFYTDFANQDNTGNPNFDSNHQLGYSKNADGTVNINVVDKNTGAVVRVAKENATTRDFIAATYQQLDPTKSYETQVDNAAKSALKQQEYDWEERKLGLQYGYDIGKQNNKYQQDIGLEGYKHNNTIGLTNLKHGQALELEGLRQDGSNYRTELGIASKVAGGSGSGSGTGSGKASKAVESGVQGAINYAQANAPQLQFIANNPRLYNMTVAMMGIESAGKPNAFSGSSHGLMQINGDMALRFKKKFGIAGDPLTDANANIQTGAAFLNHLDQKYGGDTTLIAAAYNAGEPAIDAAVKSWKASGQQGSWFDHLNLRPDARQQVYGHIVKYNQALGYLGFDGQPTNITVAQENQNNAKQTAQSKENFRKGVSVQATASANKVATSMTKELELGKDTSPALIGSLAQAQTEVIKFASDQTREGRTKAYNNIYAIVDNTVKQTEAGAMMTPAQRKNYVQQKTAELVGATNMTEAGSWITHGKNKHQVDKNAPNLSVNMIDNVFLEADVNEKSAPKAPAKPAQQQSSQAFIPLRSSNPMISEGITKTASQFKAPAKTAAAKPAAAKPKSKMDQQLEARAARKKAQADAIAAKKKAEADAEVKAKTKAKAESKANFLRPVQFTGVTGVSDKWKNNLKS